MECKTNGYKLTLSGQIKYLGIYLDMFLNGQYQSKLTMQKLARSRLYFEFPNAFTFQFLKRIAFKCLQ